LQKKIIPIVIVTSAIIFIVAYQTNSKVEFVTDFLSERKVMNPPIYEHDIEKFLHVTDYDDINQKRKQMTNYVWKEDIMSEELPDQIIANFKDPRFSDLENLDRIEKLEISMDKGVNSTIYHFIPKSSNQRLVIYHQGHDGDFILGKKTISHFLDNNYAVLALSMPLVGQNNKPIVDTEFGKIQLLSHKYFELLESPDFSPMIFFFEPINISLNYLDTNYKYDEYSIIGISGGGWTATVYSAIDQRINKTFSVAGSVPFFLRTTDDNIGDYEQINSDFYRIADYLDLYVMASAGNDRKFIQIFNVYDPCCFYGDKFEIYGNIVKNAIVKIGAGYFEIYLDKTTKQHEISDNALKIIESELEKTAS